MNILIVSDSYPAFDRSSYELRFSRLVHILAEQHQIMLCPLDVPYMEKELGVDAVQRYRNKLLNQGAGIADKGLASALQAAQHYDVILFIIYSQASPNNLRLVRYWAPTARIVIDSVDVQFGRFLSRARLTGEKKDFDHAEKIKSDELADYKAADLIIVVSESEQELLLPELPNKQVRIISNIHPMGEFTLTEARPGKTLLFVGWGQYDPNVDAVTYFARDVFPLILKQIPNARLKVVGGDYPKEVHNLHGGSIEIIGRVPEMAPYLHEAYISIAPLRYGSGVKGKIGEALSYGLPVVTTSIGLEGFGLTPNKNVLLGDTPEEFAAHVISLLVNPSLHAEISLAGWEFLKDSFSEDAVREQVHALFKDLEHMPRRWLVLQSRRLFSFIKQQTERHILWRLARVGIR